MSQLFRWTVAGAVVAVLAVSSPATAQGLNFGVFGQHSWTDIAVTETTIAPPVTTESLEGDIDGLGGGVAIGYDHRLGSSVVVGIVADVAIGDWREDYNNGPTLVGYYDIGRVFTIRGRLGYLIQPNTLVYLTAGYANASVKHGTVALGSPVVSYTADGWTLGAGGELEIGNGLALFGEYLYTNFSSGDFTLHQERHEVDLDSNALRFGVKLKFGG